MRSTRGTTAAVLHGLGNVCRTCDGRPEAERLIVACGFSPCCEGLSDEGMIFFSGLLFGGCRSDECGRPTASGPQRNRDLYSQTAS